MGDSSFQHQPFVHDLDAAADQTGDFVNTHAGSMLTDGSNTGDVTIRTPASSELRGSQQIAAHLGSLLHQCQANDAAGALIPWFCDALPSPKSRRDYFAALGKFFAAMQVQGVHPYAVTGDHVRMYKEALVEAGAKPNTVCQALSVLRGTYQQFGKKGLVSWVVVGDIQAVKSPRVEKNTTPALTETEACALLHAPDTDTVMGLRDHALLFVLVKTACRSNAIGKLTVGDLERTDTDWFVVVTEKRKNVRRLNLLEAAAPLLRWLDLSGIGFDDPGHPVFTPLERDTVTPKRQHLSQQSILEIVKKYGRLAGIHVDRAGRSVCTHSIRSTALNNALKHGAAVENVQQWAGHCDIRTTQQYIDYRKEGAEEAARRCQIR